MLSILLFDTLRINFHLNGRALEERRSYGDFTRHFDTRKHLVDSQVFMRIQDSGKTRREKRATFAVEDGKDLEAPLYPAN